MPSLSSVEHLRQQYSTSANLQARIALHARFSVNRQGWYNWVWAQLDLPPQACLLEVGCGEGAFWRANRARIPAGWRLLLSDLSPGMVRAATADLGELATLMVADAQALPCAPSSMDGVMANHMLYHVPNRAQALAQLCGALRPGGRFYATTIGRYHMHELNELIEAIAPGADPWGGQQPTHFLLQTATPELEPWFEQVEVRAYEDALQVTEVEPLVAYALSTAAREPLLARLPEFVALVEQRMAGDGCFRITKESGMLTGVRPG